MQSKMLSKRIKPFVLIMAFLFLSAFGMNMMIPTVAAVGVSATATQALTNTSTVSDTAVVKGNHIKLIGSATGGTAPYQYAMVARHSTSSTWTILKNYSSANSYTWTPAKTGTYYVSIKVKDSDGTVVSITKTIKVSASALVNNSTVSATSITKGAYIRLIGSATGGTGSYQYAMVARHSTSSTWTILKNYSSANSYTWTPAKTGTYYVSIKVKDSDGTVVSITKTIKVSASALVNNSTVSATSITVGAYIRLIGSATGGTAPYQYAMNARHSTSDTWSVLKSYSSTNSYTWTPAKTGTYYVSIKVKDSDGTVVSETFTVTVNDRDSSADTDLSQKLAAYIDEVIRLVNVERTSVGLSSLTKREDVCALAAIRAEEISESFSHTRPNGTSCFTLFDEYNISYWALGENIAAGYTTPAAVMEGWMNSEGHKANILDENFTGIGVGCYEKNGRLYWSQFFIKS